MGMSVEMPYPMETSERLKATEDKDKTVVDTPETRREKANESIDPKTGDWYKKTASFVKPEEQNNTRENESSNSNLKNRVDEIERIVLAMQKRLDDSINRDPQLLALVNSGAINYNPDAMGKPVFV